MASDQPTALLINAVRDFHWMARRYCDGRMSTAPTAFNGLVKRLLSAGVALGTPLFARDGMGRDYDGLTDAEAAEAEMDMPRGHAILEDEWRGRTADMLAALKWARTCVPAPSDCHAAIVAAIAKAEGETDNGQ